MTNLTIDSEAVRGIVARAVFDQIGEDQRQLVITQAVEKLLEEPKDTYGRKSGASPLAVAFNQAVVGIARDVVTDYLKQDAVEATVRDAITTKITELLNRDDWLYTSIGQAVGDRIEEIMKGDR